MAAKLPGCDPVSRFLFTQKHKSASLATSPRPHRLDQFTTAYFVAAGRWRTV
jgi:hypothetical protein